MKYDRIIIGAGLYGLYAALFCSRRGMNVIVLECDKEPFMRATTINQARVHQGYHYPRSLSTAMRSANYFDRFNNDFGFCVNSEFDQVYATSDKYSWTNAEQFIAFCKAANIPCEPLHPDQFFNSGMCDGAFLTREYTYDAGLLKEYMLDEIKKVKNGSVTLKFGVKIDTIEASGEYYTVSLSDGEEFSAPFVLNATYASVNQIIDKIGGEKFKIKYELCELILCHSSEKLKNIGITVMDGPFFSIMPYGKTGFHSLTSVTFTPHATSYDDVPTFSCQDNNDSCSPCMLGNCNDCTTRPPSAFPYMERLAKKYMRSEYDFTFDHSIYSMKPILMKSEIDDSRPTVIRVHTSSPTFVSVLSGKINTVYDLDEVLING